MCAVRCLPGFTFQCLLLGVSLLVNQALAQAARWQNNRIFRRLTQSQLLSYQALNSLSDGLCWDADGKVTV